MPEANVIPLLTFDRVHFAMFHFQPSVFLRNTGLGTNILFIKLELNCVANGNEMDQMVRNDIACNFILIVRFAFPYALFSF